MLLIKKDLTKEFDKISSIVRQIQLRNAKRRFNDLNEAQGAR